MPGMWLDGPLQNMSGMRLDGPLKYVWNEIGWSS
jgi:hypothetical protein